MSDCERPDGIFRLLVGGGCIGIIEEPGEGIISVNEIFTCLSELSIQVEAEKPLHMLSEIVKERKKLLLPLFNTTFA